MGICIGTDSMTLEMGDRVVATTRFSEHAAADGNGAWIVSTRHTQLLNGKPPIVVLTTA